MDILQRATQLLRPFMAEERRSTWLTLAFHAEQRDVYDAIPQSGATADFTVRCVSRLLGRGCLGSRHALSVLLDVVRAEVGEDRQEAFRALIDELDRKCAGIQAGTGASAPVAVPAVPERDLVYISYRHRDREWHDRLRRVLDADPRLRALIWDDTEIPGGADWQQQIDEHVSRARIMIMLASDDYFDPTVSGAFEPEIKPALQAHANGKIAILWLPVRSLSIATSPVRHITSATGAGAVPLERLSPEEQAASLIKVYREVLRLLGMPGEPVSPVVQSAALDAESSRPDRLVAHKKSQIPGANMTSTSTILFLAASPDGEQKLALDTEAREIREKIRASEHRDSLVFRTEWAVRPDDLLQYLNEYRPQSVHFSGHGTDNELILNDKNGQAKPVSREALRALFGLHSKTVRLAVLNACFSKKQAEAIVEVIDCAVGMKKEIGDDAAIVFAAAFYRKLGFGASVKEAFEEGRVALMMEGIPEEKTPELLVKNGVDAAQVFLVGPDANPG